MTTAPEQIKAALDRIHGQVQDFTTGANSRISQVEQLVAGLEAHSSRYSAGSGGPSVGAQALQEFGEDSAFSSAAEASRRGGKLPHFNARINVDTSLRAALTNESGSSSNGGIPSQPEQRGVVGPVARPLRLLDVLPTRPTTSDSVEHIRLSATGSAAEQVEEGTTKAELAFDGTLVRAEIATVAAWMAASRQVLGDHSALQSTIDSVLRDKVSSKLEDLILNSTSGSGRIEGLLSLAPTFVPVVATSVVDTIGEAVAAMANSGYRASAVVLHPSDWFAIQTLKSNAEGLYLLGLPTAPIAPALWNVPVVVTSSIAAGTALVFDARFVTVLDREQLAISVSNSHSDFFTKNLVAILAECRAGLEILDEFSCLKFDLPSE